jgi:transketolase
VCGVTCLWADFGVFGSCRGLQPAEVANDINHSSLKLLCADPRCLDVGETARLIQSIDYIGLLRNLFGWRLLVPALP